MTTYDSHKNFAYSTIAVAPVPASSGVAITVATGDGTKFPAVPFNATICPSGVSPTVANAEIVRVTLIATDVLTITRNQESTSARTIVTGDQIFASITAKTLTDVETLKADLASPTFTGTPSLPTATTATTQSANDNSTKLATTAYVDASSHVWNATAGTRTANTTVTVVGDQTAIFKKGMVVKWTESATIRCAMVSIPSTFSSVTTITLIGDTCASIDSGSFMYSTLGIEAFNGWGRFSLAGNIGATGTDVANAWYATEPCRVFGADLQVGTAGTTNSTTIDINGDAGTTLFTTKPTLASTVAHSATPFTADTATSLALNDRVSIDIDAIQTTNAVDLYVQLYLFPTRYLYL